MKLYCLHNALHFNSDSTISRLILVDFPGGSDSKVSAYNAGELGSISDWGTKVLQSSQHGQEKKVS